MLQGASDLAWDDMGWRRWPSGKGKPPNLPLFRQAFEPSNQPLKSTISFRVVGGIALASVLSGFLFFAGLPS